MNNAIEAYTFETIAKLKERVEELEAEIERLRKFHVEDMRVTNESADFHIKECQRLRERITQLESFVKWVVERVDSPAECEQEVTDDVVGAAHKLIPTPGKEET